MRGVSDRPTHVINPVKVSGRLMPSLLAVSDYAELLNSLIVLFTFEAYVFCVCFVLIVILGVHFARIQCPLGY